MKTPEIEKNPGGELRRINNLLLELSVRPVLLNRFRALGKHTLLRVGWNVPVQREIFERVSGLIKEDVNPLIVANEGHKLPRIKGVETKIMGFYVGREVPGEPLTEAVIDNVGWVRGGNGDFTVFGVRDTGKAGEEEFIITLPDLANLAQRQHARFSIQT